MPERRLREVFQAVNFPTAHVEAIRPNAVEIVTHREKYVEALEAINSRPTYRCISEIMLPIVRVQPKNTLHKLVRIMRKAAQRGHVTAVPKYNTDHQAAFAEAASQEPSVLNDGSRQILQVGPDSFIIVVLTIDVLPNEPKCWHLSMSLPARTVEAGPQRVPDDLAKWISKSFETLTEGPAEGAFKHVRHFRGPYQPV